MAGIVWQILQLVGGYYIGHQLAHSQSLYGSTFGIVLGLLAWLYLQAEATLYAAEANVVWVRKLYPRSLAPPHTEEDVHAYQLYAEAEARNKDETVTVTVPGPSGGENGEGGGGNGGDGGGNGGDGGGNGGDGGGNGGDGGGNGGDGGGNGGDGGGAGGEKAPGSSPAPAKTEPEQSAVSAPPARGEDPHDSGDTR